MDASGFSEGRRLALKMRAVFNGETLVNEVAFDVRRGLQHHLLGTHRADKAATDHHILRNDVTLKLASAGAISVQGNFTGSNVL